MEDIQNELATLGTQPFQPASRAEDHALVVPDTAMPVVPPTQCPPTISMQPWFNDQNFATTELLIPSQTPISTRTWTYNVNTTSHMLLDPESAYLHIDALVRPVPTVEGGIIPVFDYAELPVAFNGFDGNANTFPDGGFWNTVDTCIIYVNGTPINQYQSGLLVDQLRLHPFVLPQSYTGEYAVATKTQMGTKTGDLGVSQFYAGRTQGAIKPYSDLSLMTATPTSITNPQHVYFDVPLQNLWFFNQTPGRIMTNSASISIRFQMKRLTLQGIHHRNSKPANVTEDGNGFEFFPPLVSIPFELEFINCQMMFKQKNLNVQAATSLAAQSIPRPLVLLMNNIEILAEPSLQNKDLMNPGTWGITNQRMMLKGSGILPKFVIPIPKATVEWGPRTYGTGPTITKWPYGVNGGIITRDVFLPGFVYIRRIMIGGQVYYPDPALDADGEIRLADPGGWIQYCEKRAKELQQQGNYLDAPDQKWLNLRANERQLDPLMAWDANVMAYGPGNLNRGMTAYTRQLEYGKWMGELGLTGIALSQDTGLDTLSDTRTASLEIAYFTAPYLPGTNLATNGCDFLGWCEGITYEGDTASHLFPVNLPPTAGTISLSFGLPYPMTLSYGQGRQTSYNFLQTTVPALSAVPM